LANERGRIEELEREARDRQSIIDRLSSQDSLARSTHSNVQAENTKLFLRIQELEANLQQVSHAASTASAKPRASLAEDRVRVLQQQLNDLQAMHKRDASELRSTAEKLSRVQSELDQAQNQHIALQRSSQAREAELRDAVAEKEEELAFLRAQAGDNAASSREEQLLGRIEEEEMKVQTLELTVRRQQDELDGKKNADKQIRALQRAADSATRRADDLSGHIARLEQEKRSTEEHLAGVMAEAESTSNHFAELQNIHRRLLEESACVVPPSHACSFAYFSLSVF
jgi:predicted  nucleic acid-binding Zn-ribbon protein